jgi:hypothetical protein
MNKDSRPTDEKGLNRDETSADTTSDTEVRGDVGVKIDADNNFHNVKD